MDNKQIFNEHFKRLAKEGWLKSVFAAMLIGFPVMLAVAAVTWVLEANGLWYSLAALLVFTGGFAPLFYFKRFRPTAKQIARRIDALGLEERVITMTELSDSDTYMALRQREDAREKLKSTNEKQIKFRFSAAVVACVCVLGVLGLSLTTANTLSFYGVIPKFGEIIDSTLPQEPIIEFEVSYFVEGGEGGIIEGEELQIVEQGQSSSLVFARADEGWSFQGWSDGLPDPYRSDENIMGNMEVFAVFEQLGNPGEGDGEPSDLPPDQPGENPSNDGGDEDGDGPIGGGRYEPANQIIDEETYYRDVYEQYYDQILELLSSGAEIPEDLRIIIEAYFNILK